MYTSDGLRPRREGPAQIDGLGPTDENSADRSPGVMRSVAPCLRPPPRRVRRLLDVPKVESARLTGSMTRPQAQVQRCRATGEPQ